MASGADVIGTAADLISSVDFSGTAIEPSGDGADELAAPGSLDGASEGEEPVEATEPAVADDIQPEAGEAETPEEQPAEEEAAAEKPAAETADQLPDGVREVSVGGKKEM